MSQKKPGCGGRSGLVDGLRICRLRPGWQTGLIVTHYVDLTSLTRRSRAAATSASGKGFRPCAGREGLKGTRNQLFHNNGDETFTDVSDKSGVSKIALSYGFTVLTGDFDNDGWPDVYVAVDSTASQMFHNNGDGTFTETAVMSGVAYNDNGHEQAGMGAYAGDYDGDGWLDIIKTNFSNDTPTLYHNNHDGTFTDATLEAGLGKTTQFLGWGTLFVDVDNDGWPDIFMANGHVYPEVDKKGLSNTFRERKVLYWNQHNGKFSDVSLQAGPGMTTPLNSHGVAAADFDNDGSVEILVNNSHDPPSLLKNYGDHGNWILLALTGTKSNGDGIGARVTVPCRRPSADAGSAEWWRLGHISQSDFRLHFGLGRNESRRGRNSLAQRYHPAPD